MPRNSLEAIFSSVDGTSTARKKPMEAMKMEEITCRLDEAVRRVSDMLDTTSARLVMLVGMGDWGRDNFIKEFVKVGKEVTIASADDGMMKSGKYVFDMTKLTQCHLRCQGTARNVLMSTKTGVVFVANKNTIGDHIKMYAQWGYPFIAVKFVPASRANAVALGVGNIKQIPTGVFESAYDEMENLQLVTSTFPKLRGICTIHI